MTSIVYNVSFVLQSTVIMQQNGFGDEILVQPKQVAAASPEGAVAAIMLEPSVVKAIADKITDKSQMSRLLPVVVQVNF